MTVAATSFGVSLSNRAVVIGGVAPSLLCDIAAEAESSGFFDSVWVGDSWLTKPRLEAVTTLSAIAARTGRVRLGTACLATFPTRHPVLLALQWASLDLIANGRTVLCVCLGGRGRPETDWGRLEAKVAGIRSEERAGRMEEGLTLIRRLWHEENVTHEGRFYKVEGVTLQPRPVQNPCPIWIASNPQQHGPSSAVNTERVLRRVAHYADGWMSASLSPDQFRGYRRQLDGYLGEEGKAADTFPTALHLRAHVGPDREAAYQETAAFLKAYYGQEYTRQHLETQCAIGTPEECVEKFRAYANAGCGTIIIRLLSWNLREQLQRWITQVLPQVVG